MISLIRIDDRLIHGQIMAVWVRVLSIDHLVVADDTAAADSFSRQLMQLAMPVGIRLTVVAISNSADVLATASADPSHTLVLLRNVDSAERLFCVYPYRHLNVGGIGMTPDRRTLWRSISVSNAETTTLQNLSNLGVDVYLQMLPSDEKRRITGS